MTHEEFLLHYGVKGMRWGARKFTPSSIRAWHSNRQNRKIDKSFKKWQQGSANRSSAISQGKKMIDAKNAVENDRKNMALKTQYKAEKKAYKKSFRSNTLYRKGQVQGEIHSYASRKALSKAKKIKKELDKDPKNKGLRKQYNKLMSQHAIERTKARKSPKKYANRSALKANIKRQLTTGAKNAVKSAAIIGGAKALDEVLYRKGVTKGRTISPETMYKIGTAMEKAQRMARYF